MLLVFWDAPAPPAFRMCMLVADAKMLLQEYLLQFLGDTLSCYFGTFVLDNEKACMDTPRFLKSTLSLWDERHTGQQSSPARNCTTSGGLEFRTGTDTCIALVFRLRT